MPLVQVGALSFLAQRKPVVQRMAHLRKGRRQLYSDRVRAAGEQAGAHERADQRAVPQLDV